MDAGIFFAVAMTGLAVFLVVLVVAEAWGRNLRVEWEDEVDDGLF